MGVEVGAFPGAGGDGADVADAGAGHVVDVGAIGQLADGDRADVAVEEKQGDRRSAEAEVPRDAQSSERILGAPPALPVAVILATKLP